MSHKIFPRKASEIREAFLHYFSGKGHAIVGSSPLVPGDDPTLLFTNAGMVQFKDVFLGRETRTYKTAASAQLCLRAGGKHNDLENVGYTARHHTCFEMLGNFSFGDYFKKEAICDAWVFLVEILGLPPEKLWVTVYQSDEETADIWLKDIGISPSRFSRCGARDNFWSMGEVGPSGPCTEIFYDHGPGVPGGPPGSEDADGDRYVEIWNLVFMQYDRDAQGVLHPLPKPSVDTGMGLERIAAVMQGVHNNFDTDLFLPLTAQIAELSKVGTAQDHPSVRVIADHFRAAAFLIAEGVLPGNEGRDYVLRRIIRRAIRHAKKLSLKLPFFKELMVPFVSLMGNTYPILVDQKTNICNVLEKESERFQMTLESGLLILQDAMKNLKNDEMLRGEVAFKLYDTYGFPLDLTEDIAREHGLTVDKAGFQNAMDSQRALSKASSRFRETEGLNVSCDLVSQFIGYETTAAHAKILAIFQAGKLVSAVDNNVLCDIILEKTPFYPEGGGQVGDRGVLMGKHGRFLVEETVRLNEAILHRGVLAEGKLTQEETIEAMVDETCRLDTQRNHTATHLLHAALRNFLGVQVSQKGSLVENSRARFDFSYNTSVDDSVLHVIEAWCNEKIRENLIVKTELMSFDAAKQKGALALFSEKYEKTVRVLSIAHVSTELCGGTHVAQTGEIGLFKILREFGVAGGIRRIEFVTGRFACHFVDERLQLCDKLSRLLKTDYDELPKKLEQTLQLLKIAEKKIITLEQEKALLACATFLSEAETLGKYVLLVKKVNFPMETLRLMVDWLKQKLPMGVIVLFSSKDGVLQVVSGIGKDALSVLPPAKVFVTALCGKGGGRPDLASGGSVVPSDLEEKIASLRALLTSYSCGGDTSTFSKNE